MISKVGRLTRFFGRRYVNVCDLTVRNCAVVSNNVCHICNAQQKYYLCSNKCPSWNKNLQNIRFSTGNKRESIPSVDYSYIKELPKHPETLLIDVREPQELAETGIIPTSINIPLDCVLQVLADDVRPQIFKTKYGRHNPAFDDEIIFTCKLGKRAYKAAEIVKAMGFTNVKYYAGSWNDWAQHEIK